MTTPHGRHIRKIKVDRLRELVLKLYDDLNIFEEDLQKEIENLYCCGNLQQIIPDLHKIIYKIKKIGESL